MNRSGKNPVVSFLFSVTVFHTVTYFIFGFVASSIFNYKEVFGLPVITEYYQAFGSVSNVLGPVIQVFRGVLFGLVLLPFKRTIAESRYGWLHLWLLFVGIGILGTPAAAPSSIEGAVYSKLPLWFHLLGFPEILLQTLAFSMLVHDKISEYKIISSARAKKFMQALSTACLSFIGYTGVSILFALLARADINAGSADFRVLGQFVLPLVFTLIVALMTNEVFLLKHAGLYLASALSLLLYQRFVLGDANWIYVLLAPVLPVAISFLLLKEKKIQKED